MENEIKELVTKLLELLSVKGEVSVERKDESYEVRIDASEASGLLIGSHGSTLVAIGSFVMMALKQSSGEWVRVNVDIAGWVERKNQELTELAEQTAERARQTGEAQNLYNLDSAQRRIIHVALQNAEGIETESMGEGEERYLVVRSKSS
jgi:spoIIIJ-associated protein